MLDGGEELCDSIESESVETRLGARSYRFCTDPVYEINAVWLEMDGEMRLGDAIEIRTQSCTITVVPRLADVPGVSEALSSFCRDSQPRGVPARAQHSRAHNILCRECSHRLYYDHSHHLAHTRTPPLTWHGTTWTLLTVHDLDIRAERSAFLFGDAVAEDLRGALS